MKTSFKPDGWFPVETAAGTFAVRITPRGLAELRFPSARDVKLSPAAGAPPRMRALLDATNRAVKAAIAGTPHSKMPPLDWDGATEFQCSVWRELLCIPAGRTRSYGEIAARLRKPGAARAVGAACGANPIPLLVPCHRVLAGDGGLGGFSCGLEWKRRLLDTEAAAAAD